MEDSQEHSKLNLTSFNLLCFGQNCAFFIPLILASGCIASVMIVSNLMLETLQQTPEDLTLRLHLSKANSHYHFTQKPEDGWVIAKDRRTSAPMTFSKETFSNNLH